MIAFYYAILQIDFRQLYRACIEILYSIYLYMYAQAAVMYIFYIYICIYDDTTHYARQEEEHPE